MPRRDALPHRPFGEAAVPAWGGCGRRRRQTCRGEAPGSWSPPASPPPPFSSSGSLQAGRGYPNYLRGALPTPRASALPAGSGAQRGQVGKRDCGMRGHHKRRQACSAAFGVAGLPIIARRGQGPTCRPLTPARRIRAAAQTLREPLPPSCARAEGSWSCACPNPAGHSVGRAAGGGGRLLVRPRPLRPRPGPFPAAPQRMERNSTGGRCTLARGGAGGAARTFAVILYPFSRRKCESVRVGEMAYGRRVTPMIPMPT